MSRLMNNQPCTLYNFPDEPSGMIRDYCFVGDVVKANLAALERGGGDFFNIGTGTGTKTLVLYKSIFETVKEVRPGISEDLADPLMGKARPGDIPRSCLVLDKARRSLGWLPETELKEGLRRTLEWRMKEPP